LLSLATICPECGYLPLDSWMHFCADEFFGAVFAYFATSFAREQNSCMFLFFFVKMKFWFEGFVEQSIERTCFSFWFSFFCSLFQYIEYEIEYVAWVLCS